MDMKKKLSETNKVMERFQEKSPEKIKRFHQLLEAAEKEGVLDGKQKELIAIALSVTQNCEWCISFHVNNALEAGATEDEIIESAWMAVVMGGSPALMHAGLVLDALEDLSD